MHLDYRKHRRKLSCALRSISEKLGNIKPVALNRGAAAF